MQEHNHFEAGRLEEANSYRNTYACDDRYAICLLKHTHKTYTSTLQLFHPVHHSDELYQLRQQKGFYCFAAATCFTPAMQQKLNGLPIFSQHTTARLSLTPGQTMQMEELFAKMIADLQTAYLYKTDLLKTYFMQLIHFALKNGQDAGHNF